jgi:superfamily II DNA helicase RecQ
MFFAAWLKDMEVLRLTATAMKDAIGEIKEKVCPRWASQQERRVERNHLAQESRTSWDKSQQLGRFLQRTRDAVQLQS